jgi:hypothetical protein
MHPELETALKDRRKGKGTDAAVTRERKSAWDRLERDPRWLKDHPTKAAAEVNLSPEADEIRVDDEEYGELYFPVPEKDSGPDPHYEDIKHMSDVEDWHNDDIPEELHDVIPEAFLWTVFDQLVDAFIILGTGGGGGGAEYEEWDEIVHKDVHLQNVFVKRAEGAKGVPRAATSKETDHRLVRFEANEVNSIGVFDC